MATSALRSLTFLQCVSLLALCLLMGASSGAVASERIAVVVIGERSVEWRPIVEYEGLLLRLAVPDGSVREVSFVAGASPVVDFDDGEWADGVYVYELTGRQRLDEALQQEILSARRRGDEEAAAALEEYASRPRVQFGYFRILGGVGVAAGLGEEEVEDPATKDLVSPSRGSLLPRDQVVGDDLIVVGSVCAGSSCVNGEAFGNDTLRLKQPVVRVKLEDTSTAGGVPSNDWQITVNDEAAGGADRFSIDDITGNQTPLTIQAGAPSNSLYVAASGNLGFGTAVPASSLHVLRNDSAATFQATSQTSGATEAAQFIMQRSRSGPSAVQTGDNLGLLSFRGYNGTGYSGSRALLGALATESWSSTANGARFVISTTANGTTAPTVRFEIRENGDIVANGVVVHSSSREVKENFVTVDAQAILARLVALPMAYWNYKKDDASLRHLGPTSEDFQAAFGLGDEPRYIALSDSVGVALAAVQGLHQTLVAKDQRIADLEARLAALEARVGRD